MKEKYLIFLGWNAYGDFLSYNGMIRFLLKYFDVIYIKADAQFLYYLNNLYNDVLDRVKFVSIDDIINITNHNKKIPVLNTIQYVDFDQSGVTSIVNADNFGNISLKSLVPSEIYFNGDNKISNFLGLGPNETISKLEYVDNASNFYINIGLNPEIRYKYFHYNRLITNEDNLYKDLLSRNNISFGEDYIVICDSHNTIRDEYKTMKYVNIDYCTDNPLNLITLLQKSKEVHLIDNSNLLFVYYLYMSDLVKIDNVTVHIYSRNRYEYYYMMFMNPKIDKWKIIF
jgi:hypothetical protein